jgi:hypothetical protein
MVVFALVVVLKIKRPGPADSQNICVFANLGFGVYHGTRRNMFRGTQMRPNTQKHAPSVPNLSWRCMYVGRETGSGGSESCFAWWYG